MFEGNDFVCLTLSQSPNISYKSAKAQDLEFKYGASWFFPAKGAWPKSCPTDEHISLAILNNSSVKIVGERGGGGGGRRETYHFSDITFFTNVQSFVHFFSIFIKKFPTTITFQ